MDLDALLTAPGLTGTAWSVDVRCEGRPVHQHDPHRVLGTASLAKVFLLVELAERLVAGAIDGGALVDRRSVPPVGDSGLWQHLATDRLPVDDAALLVGAVSDNLATNVLLDLVGLEAVRSRAAGLAPGGSTLHDLVRDARTPQTPPTLSEGCASDWASVFLGLHHGAAEGDPVATRVLGWLAAGTDLSMVASAFDLDPLSHGSGADAGVRLWNKTGTDVGVRAEAGIVEVDDTSWTYAVICTWPGEQGATRGHVLQAMRAIGAAIRGGRT